MSGTTECAGCGRTISDRVARCPFCNAARAAAPAPSGATIDDSLTCPRCQRYVPASTRFCRACKREIPEERPTAKCPDCLAPYLPSLAACPRCGTPNPAPQGPVTPAEAAPPPFMTARREPAPTLEGPRCPLCRGPAGPASIEAQAWTERSALGDVLRGRVVFGGELLQLPGPCEACAPGLARSRLLATGLLWLPIPVLEVGLAFESTVAATLVALGLYALLFLFPWPAYTWADAVVYGGALEAAAGRPSADKIHFPVHWLHTVARLAGAAFVGLVTLLVMSFVIGGV